MSSISCEDFRIENPSTATCNVNTVDGYYWKITSKLENIATYGYLSSNVYPSCGDSFVGKTAMSYSYDSDVFYYDAASIYCPSIEDTTCTNCNCLNEQGPTTVCTSTTCGLYSVTCSKITAPTPSFAPTSSSGSRSRITIPENVDTAKDVRLTLQIAIFIFIILLVIVFMVAYYIFSRNNAIAAGTIKKSRFRSNTPGSPKNWSSHGSNRTGMNSIDDNRSIHRERSHIQSDSLNSSTRDVVNTTEQELPDSPL